MPRGEEFVEGAGAPDMEAWAWTDMTYSLTGAQGKRPFIGVGQLLHRLCHWHPYHFGYFLVVLDGFLCDQRHSPEQHCFRLTVDLVSDGAKVFFGSDYTASFFFHFPKGGSDERLAILQLPFGQGPIAIALPVDNQDFVTFRCTTTENTAGRENYILNDPSLYFLHRAIIGGTST